VKQISIYALSLRHFLSRRLKIFGLYLVMLRDVNILSVFFSISFFDISLSLALFLQHFAISHLVVQYVSSIRFAVLLDRRFRLINLLLFKGIDRQLSYMDLPHVK